MSDLPVIFGMGAAQAGQSWLFNALAQSPDVRSLPLEELHYWDTFAPRDAEEHVQALNARAELMTERHGLDGPGLDLAELAAVLEYDRTDDAAYHAYLAAALVDHAGAYAMDFTPSYSMLSIAELERAVAFSSRSVFLFIMCDPVARLWAHVRMNAARRLRAGDDLDAKANFILRRALQGLEGHIMMRGDYASALRRLQAVVPRGRLYVLVAEQALCATGVAALCRALKIAPAGVPADEPVFQPSYAGMDPAMMAAARWQLRDQYDAVAEILGEMPASWLPETREVSAAQPEEELSQ
ncbi:hypothetical protein BVG79_01888 [Ketogulonicigenium robustum]|uniref:Uncharacterized protein n=1 Tax=Ketogulonicigenium robustum TaxID=92947 RepID=A0A1W6P1M2_9RHOB|nr:hypothetical protein [Ketogulonicigenium robustum]ARO15230.1 hypothetical protein BVG79_01888 [Ketogulonicigenium robustum]